MAASCSAHAAAEKGEVVDEVVVKEVAGRDPVFAQMLAAIDAKSIDTPEVEKVGRGGPSRCGSRIIGIVVGGGPDPASAPGATRQSKDHGRQRRRGDQEEEER